MNSSTLMLAVSSFGIEFWICQLAQFVRIIFFVYLEYLVFVCVDGFTPFTLCELALSRLMFNLDNCSLPHNVIQVKAWIDVCVVERCYRCLKNWYRVRDPVGVGDQSLQLHTPDAIWTLCSRKQIVVGRFLRSFWAVRTHLRWKSIDISYLIGFEYLPF